MTETQIEQLKKVAKWVISENERGASGVPKFMAKMAKEALGDSTPLPSNSSNVKIRKLRSISVTTRE